MHRRISLRSILPFGHDPVSLRTRLLAFVLMLMAPILALIIVDSAEHRRTAIYHAQDDAGRLANLVASQQSQQVQGARQLLLTLSRLPEVQRQDEEACSTLMADLLTQYPSYRFMGAVDRDGTGFCFGLPADEDSVNTVGRPWFERVKAGEDFAIGDFHIGLITGEPGVAYAYPIFNAKGVFNGAVLVTAELGWVTEWLADIEAPDGAVLRLVDNAGLVLAQSPHDPAQIGQPMPEISLISRIETEGDGVTGATDLGGGSNFYGFASLDGSVGSLYAVVGIPEAIVLAEIRDMRTQYLVGLGLLTLLVIGIALSGSQYLVIRPVDRVIGATERLARGDLTSRIELTGDVAELDRLGRSINHLADSLQMRAAEVDRYTGELVSEIEERKLAQFQLQQSLDSLAEQIRQRQKAELADALKLQYIAMLSHELRTPLTSIKGFATTLLADDVEWDREQQVDFIGIINEEADALLALFDQLLDIAQIESSTLRLHRVDTNICEIISMAGPRLHVIASQHDLKIDFPDDMPPVPVDRGRMVQVILNLVSNAARYSPPGSTIRLDAARLNPAADAIRINVSDEGIGIPFEERDRVFLPFARTEKGNVIKGTGLGLAICRGIVEGHGGRIWIAPQQGTGTTVSFSLPMHAAEGEEPGIDLLRAMGVAALAQGHPASEPVTSSPSGND